MTTTITRGIRSALQAVLALFVDDGVYTAVTIAWITIVVTLGSHSTSNHRREELLLPLGLDLIFTLSVILRVRNTVRSQSRR